MRRREYLAVYARGERVAGAHLVVFVNDTDSGHARLGITATKKIGGAVARNRVRRCVREAFRKHRHDLPAWDIVVNAKGSATRASSAELEEDLLRLFERIQRRRRKRGSGR